jgi:hypothetical protein
MHVEERSMDMCGRENLGWGQRVGKGRERDGETRGRWDRGATMSDREGREERTQWEGCRTMGEHNTPLLKHLHIVKDVQQYKTEQRPQLCEVILRGGGC